MRRTQTIDLCLSYGLWNKRDRPPTFIVFVIPIREAYQQRHDQDSESHEIQPMHPVIWMAIAYFRSSPIT
ncbi:MAG: hypothetical protein HC769_23335 [Cyanobacteria bacterium CRU_2_1]|nr:hypothetical protein [Cyanobacteria bacterium CRU_2_1]